MKDSNYQKDLFTEIVQEANTDSSLKNNPVKPSHSMTLNLDKVLVFLLTCAILFAVIFSYGIETGKKFKESQETESLQKPFFDLRDDQKKEELIEIQVGDKKLSSESFQVQADQSIAPEESIQKLPSAESIDTSKPSTTEVPIVPAVSESSEVEVEPVPLSPYYWTVQVITYVNATYANEEVSKHQDNGLEAFVKKSGKYYQVCIGKFSSRDDAVKTLEKFQKQKDYADSYIRKFKR